MKTDAADSSKTFILPNPVHNTSNSIIKQISKFGLFRDKTFPFILIDYYVLCLLNCTSYIVTCTGSIKHHEMEVETIELACKYKVKLFILKHLIKLNRNQYFC